MKTREMRNTTNLSGKVLRGFLLLALAAMPPLAAQKAEAPAIPSEQPPGAVGYDIETGQWLFDLDGDTFPDLTERLLGTNPEDSNSSPLHTLRAAAEGGETDETHRTTEKVGFQQATCRPGFYSWPGIPRLCITLTQNATHYMQATVNCRARSSRLCSYEDLTYLYFGSYMDATYDPVNGKWLGDFVQNDHVNCGDQSITFDNDPDIGNFEGTCNKWEHRSYWCCHDRL